MKIENIESNPVFSIILDELSNKIVSHNLGSVVKTREKTGTKNDIINNILISLGTGIAANTIFELLKAIIRQHLSSLDKESKIVIDDSKITISVIINNNYNSFKNNEQRKK